MARKIKERKLKSSTVTIIGEGLTERYYFSHLKRLNGYNYVCKPRNFTEQSFDEIEKQIERVLADNGIAVCVFDLDVTRIKTSDKTKYEKMVRKYSKNSDVIICESMPSIEFWFLLHYLNTNRYFATSDEVITALRKYIPEFSKRQTFLSQGKWVETMSTDNRLQEAVNRAKNIGSEGESFSNIHLLFQHLESN